MARDGSGTYNLPAGINPVVSGTTITDEWANQTLNDVASAMTQSLSKDGQTTPSADLPMGGRKHTGVGDPTARSHYASLGVVQDNLQSRLSSVAGTGNAITGNMSIGALTSYSQGMLIVFTAANANTAAVTISINGLAPVSLVSKNQTALVSGDILTGRTYLAYYNNTVGTGAFVLISEASSTSTSPAQIATSGWVRPADGTYDSITYSGTDVTIPAGEGYIISPGTEVSPNETVAVVTWVGGTHALTNLAVSAYTTLCINSVGGLVQLAGKPPAAALRSYIVLGYVNHIDGTVRGVTTAPEIWLDDGYQAKDTTNLLQGVLTSGGRVTVNASTLKLDVANGTAMIPGATPNTPDAPNTISITGGAAISFYPYHGTLYDNFAAAIDTVDVTNYNPAAADSAPSAMTAGYYTFHRLYWLFGKFVLVYGQNQYNPPGSTFEHAVALLAYDDSKYMPPLVLSGATFLATILVQKSTASLDNGTTGAIICKGKETFGIGSSAGFTDAPGVGGPYGRQSAGWVAVLPETTPAAIGNMSTTESGAGVSVSTRLIAFSTTEWIKQIYDTTANEFRIESYVASVLDKTITWDLSTGVLNIPASSTMAGVLIGDVQKPSSATLTGELALFDDTTGRVLRKGGVPGDVVSRNVQTSPTDSTANRVLLTTAFGLGTTGALTTPNGTTAQRPGAPTEGMLRFNSTTGTFEGYINGTWTTELGLAEAAGSVKWWWSRTAIPTGYIAADGDILVRADYPRLATLVTGASVPVVTDSLWNSDTSVRASWTAGNLATTIRCPDLNGVSSGAIGSLFLRGDGAPSAAAGVIVDDAFESHTHYISWNYFNIGASGSGTPLCHPGAGSGAIGLTGDTETRPKNTAGVWIIKT